MEVASVRLPLRVIADAAGWTLTTWLVQPGAKVYRNQRVASLQSPSTGAVDHALAPHGGSIAKLFVAEGTLVSADLMADRERVIAAIEYCPHSVVFSGLCAVCGEEATSGHFADVPNESFARLPVAYNVSTLSVTRAEAEKIATVTAQRLLRNRQLSLVLDLDHTLIHATDDPRAAAVIDHSPEGVDLSSISSFSLRPHPYCILDKMHVKLRPYLFEFLSRCSKLFELHIYTMGSRPYADRIAQLIDPDKRLFRGRITSREDFDEGRSNQKNISRLFPCDDSMVLIIDDREDVWLSGSSMAFMPNLIRAKPYIFWNGLHEAYDRALAPSKQANGCSTSTNVVPDERVDVHPHEYACNAQDIGKGANLNNNDVKMSQTPQAMAITPCQKLTLKTKSNDSEDSFGHDGPFNVCGSGIDNATDSCVSWNSGDTVSQPRPAHLKDSPMPALSRELSALVSSWWELDSSAKGGCDHLRRLADVLEICHSQFFGNNGAGISSNGLCNADSNGIPAVVPPGSESNGVEDSSLVTELNIPADVKNILGCIRSDVLSGCVLTFTGVIPLSMDPEESTLWALALRYGAKCTKDFELGRTTHVIACPERGANTDKARQAVESGTAYCVDTSWLEDSVVNFEIRPELWYSLYAKDSALTWEEYRSNVKMAYDRARCAFMEPEKPMADSIRDHSAKVRSPSEMSSASRIVCGSSVKSSRVRARHDSDKGSWRPSKRMSISENDSSRAMKGSSDGAAVIDDSEIDDALNEALLA